MEPTSSDDAFPRFDGALTAAMDALSLPLSETLRRRMFEHYLLVIEANRQFNLTRITTPEDAAVRHYADALTLLKLPGIDSEAKLRVLDVGTGAGFPAAPLAIACPAWQVTAIDGTGKKARFVAESAKALGLDNLTSLHIRAADLAREARGTFDLVLMRAVSKLAEGLREAHALVAPGERIVFYKSGRVEEEEGFAGDQAAKQCGLAPMASPIFSLCGSEEPLSRSLISYIRTPYSGR